MVASRSGPQRYEDQEDPERGDIPHKRTQEKDACCVENDISNARPKIQVDPPLRHPTVACYNMSDQHGCGEKRKSLDEVLQRALQPTGHPAERGKGFVPGTRRPEIAAFETCGMRGKD